MDDESHDEFCCLSDKNIKNKRVHVNQSKGGLNYTYVSSHGSHAHEEQDLFLGDDDQSSLRASRNQTRSGKSIETIRARLEQEREQAAKELAEKEAKELERQMEQQQAMQQTLRQQAAQQQQAMLEESARQTQALYQSQN